MDTILNKEQMETRLVSESIAEETHNWYPEKDNMIVFESKGYNDKTFSIKEMHTNWIRIHGWVIASTYESGQSLLVEIKKSEKLQEYQELKAKIEEIEEII